MLCMHTYMHEHSTYAHKVHCSHLLCKHSAHVEQHDAEFGALALHHLQHVLCAQAVRRVLAHGCFDRHHVVHALHLKAVAGKVEQRIDILAQEREEVVDGLWRERDQW